MIRQRPTGAAPAIQARAEALPFVDKSFDAALVVNTLHHWTDVRAGLRELRRVTRDRIVFFHRSAGEGVPFWLTEDYFPSLYSDAKMATILGTIEDEFSDIERIRIPLPAECEDGLFSGYWSRPEKYLDPEVRQNISNFSLADPVVVEKGLSALAADLESGAWDRRYGHLRRQEEIDLGHRILIAMI